MAHDGVDKVRVVVADDDDDWRDLLAGSLERAGYSVQQVGDGLELRTLLEAAEEQGTSPDLVVSDHLMPHLTGLEVLAWAARHAPDLPFIILSALAVPYIREPALRLGAAAVIEKPIDVALLQQRLADIMAERGKSN